MTIIPKDDINRVNEIADYVIQNPSVPVEKVKLKFGITSDEYDMISDLMMPALRYYNEAAHYRSDLHALLNSLEKEKEGFENARRVKQASTYQTVS